jgi:hypothetical protein
MAYAVPTARDAGCFVAKKQSELAAKIRKHLKLLDQGRLCYKRAGDLLEEITDELENDITMTVDLGAGKKAHLKPKTGKWVRFEPYEVEVIEV